MKILVCAEAVAGEVAPTTLELINAARALLSGSAGEVIAFCAGAAPAKAQAVLGMADRLVYAAADAQSLVPACVYGEAALAVMVAEAPDLVLVPYSANGLDVAPFIAARRDLPLTSYAVALEKSANGIAVTSQIYGGKIRARTELPLPAVVMVNPGSFDEAAPSALAIERVSVVPLPSSPSGITLEQLNFPNLSEVNLAAADKIICVGRGIGEEASIAEARELADLLGAELAGSRPVIDRGWLPKLRQVGKSGQKVKPKLYLALGVSGAPEHLEGMSKSGMIIAVNTDPNAPIFNIAHYAATCDLFELIESLSARLQTAKIG
ncbi:MAG: electron transfer flavoprotein subunit alpha/FixB family protein [Parvibaculaceae bacterium]